MCEEQNKDPMHHSQFSTHMTQSKGAICFVTQFTFQIKWIKKFLKNQNDMLTVNFLILNSFSGPGS